MWIWFDWIKPKNNEFRNSKIENFVCHQPQIRICLRIAINIDNSVLKLIVDTGRYMFTELRILFIQKIIAWGSSKKKIRIEKRQNSEYSCLCPHVFLVSKNILPTECHSTVLYDDVTWGASKNHQRYILPIICPKNIEYPPIVSFSIIKFENKRRKCRTPTAAVVSLLRIQTHTMTYLIYIHTYVHTHSDAQKTSLWKPQKHKLHLNFPKYITKSYYPFCHTYS